MGVPPVKSLPPEEEEGKWRGGADCSHHCKANKSCSNGVFRQQHTAPCAGTIMPRMSPPSAATWCHDTSDMCSLPRDVCDTVLPFLPSQMLGRGCDSRGQKIKPNSETHLPAAKQSTESQGRERPRRKAGEKSDSDANSRTERLL